MKRRPPKHRSRVWHGRRRGIRLLTARLTQVQLVQRIERQLERAADAVERAPKKDRPVLQAHLARLRAAKTIRVGEDEFIRAPLSRR